MHTARGVCAAVALTGRVYALGGFTGNRAVLRCGECFDPDSGTWEALPPMHRERWARPTPLRSWPDKSQSN